MRKDQVIVAGGSIGGLAMALTLHQIGVPCVVYEAVREMRPLGVGINMQAQRGARALRSRHR
jgi:2-polyprenyl-6-methoxyphenol hydroxylase-like FAD-dependent oxidoreductase